MGHLPRLTPGFGLVNTPPQVWRAVQGPPGGVGDATAGREGSVRAVAAVAVAGRCAVVGNNAINNISILALGQGSSVSLASQFSF